MIRSLSLWLALLGMAACTAHSLVLPPTGPRNVRHFGARGDGVTDDAAAIQSAVNVGDGLVFIPSGTYRVASRLVGRSQVAILGEGMEKTILLFDDVAGAGLTYSGDHDVIASITSDVAVGDTTITVKDGSGFVVGRPTYIQDGVSSFYSRIRAKSANTITLSESSPVVLVTAQGASIFSYSRDKDIVRGVTVSDLTLRTAGSGTPSNRTELLRMERCEDAIVERIMADGARMYGVVVNNSRNVTVRNSVVTRCPIANVSSGIDVQRSTGVMITGNHLSGVSFGIVANRSPYSVVTDNILSGEGSFGQGRGIKLGPDSPYSTATGNKVMNFGLMGIYVLDSWSCVLSANNVCRVMVPGNHGIQIGGYTADKSHHNIVFDNTVVGTQGYGITINPSGGAASSLYNVISSNTISDVANGIHIGASRNLISGNWVQGYSGVAINQMTGTRDNTITGNLVEK